MTTAAWAWIVLGVVINVFWISYDLWAHFTGHLSMSSQMHTWLGSSTWGAVILALWVAVPVGFMYHFARLR